MWGLDINPRLETFISSKVRPVPQKQKTKLFIDALDACLMVHGSRLMAHGQGRPGEAHGSWPDACPALGSQSRAGPDPDRERGSGSPGPGRHLAMSHEPPLASLGHEP